jgi:hypothetical protein
MEDEVSYMALNKSWQKTKDTHNRPLNKETLKMMQSNTESKRLKKI